MEKTMITNALDVVEEKTRLNIEYFGSMFPSAATKDYIYKKVINEDWTDGFWTGILWMMYQYKGDTIYRATANTNVTSFTKRMDEHIVLDHHDMGFLYSLSCVASYKLTGDENAKKQAILAADNLLNRWHDNPGFIQAWGAMDNDAEHRFIVDSLLNLPLLYWATEVTGDQKYTEVAKRHYDIVVKYCLREDGSAYHTYYVDPKTHEPSHGVTHQGYADDSSWARGQAWAIYGIALNYGQAPSQEKMDKFIKTTDYFLDKLPADHVPYWDLIFTDGSGHERDSGSAAIAVCGILEMLQYIDDEKLRTKLLGAVDLMMESLIENYANTDRIGGAPLLNEGVYSWHEDNGVDEGNLWGDYFYVEALMRLANPEWKPYW